MQTNVELFGQMYKASTDFIARRIENSKDREYFTQIVDSILLSSETDFTFDYILEDTNNYKAAVENTSFGWSLFSNEKKYKLFAIETALDVLNSIETRFIKGGSSYYGKWQ